ncbi:uncharacterized protein J3R85_000172 [Psidium guajava]|nr:uncharacterized protein J3R85_000172 [Psidium guajava]
MQSNGRQNSKVWIFSLRLHHRHHLSGQLPTRPCPPSPSTAQGTVTSIFDTHFPTMAAATSSDRFASRSGTAESWPRQTSEPRPPRALEPCLLPDLKPREPWPRQIWRMMAFGHGRRRTTENFATVAADGREWEKSSWIWKFLIYFFISTSVCTCQFIIG